MDRRRLLGVILIVVSAAGFGSGTVISKPIYAAGLTWAQLLAWRFSIGAALAWGWILISPVRRAAIGQLGRRQALVAVGLGLWYTGNAATYYAGLETVPASLAGVLVYLYPAIVAVLSVRFASRLEGRRPWIALGIALVGVVLALGGIDLSNASSAGGVALVLLSPLIYAGWIVLSARLAGERSDRLAHETTGSGHVDDAAAASALMITSTSIVFVVIAVATGRPLSPPEIASAAWPFLLAIGFLGTFLAIQTFYAGSRRIGAAQAALVSTVEPLIIVSLAFLFLGERLAPIQLAGGGLIILGVLIAQTGRTATGAPPLDAPAAPDARSGQAAEPEAGPPEAAPLASPAAPAESGYGSAPSASTSFSGSSGGRSSNT